MKLLANAPFSQVQPLSLSAPGMDLTSAPTLVVYANLASDPDGPVQTWSGWTFSGASGSRATATRTFPAGELTVPGSYRCCGTLSAGGLERALKFTVDVEDFWPRP